MIWSGKKSKKKKDDQENLARAAKQPVPRPPVKTTEIKPGTPRANYSFFRKPSGMGPFRNEPRATGLPKGIAWGIAGIIVIFIVGFIVSFFIAKHQIAHSLATHSANLSAGIKDLQHFDPQGAEQEFTALGMGTSSLDSPLGTLGALFQGGSGELASFSDLSRQLVLLPKEYEALQEDVFSATGAFAGTSSSTAIEGSSSLASDASSSPIGIGASSTLSSDLIALQGTVDALDNDTDQMSSGIAQFGGSVSFDGQSYVALKSELHGARQFLDEVAPWVATSTPHHVLVLLENSAELRPGGGFLGSYADVTIASGTIADVAIRDVADVDDGFTQNIIPPLALQPEISRFRPADTNWFFDFPTSASKTIAYFESSHLYSGMGNEESAMAGQPSEAAMPHAPYPMSSTSFDGIIAISPRVVSDLLAVTGPVTISISSTASKNKKSIPDTRYPIPVIFASSTVSIQIQKLVQDGQAQSATYPKAVLRSLADALFAQFGASTDVTKQGLLTLALDWMSKKEVMAYFTDPVFENFITTHGAGGEVYRVPQNFNGDYLAAVDANVNGGKSDLYVSSTISWQSQINADGTIDDSVIIDRAHLGKTSPYWWYQVTNQDYLQLFVPDGSTLTNESGGIVKTIVSKVDYEKLGYAVDSTIALIESSTQPIFGYPAVTAHQENGKEVFATWSKIAAGAKTELSFEYSHHAFTVPAAGVSYQFIFEKQPSSVRHYSFEFDAPLGYQFAENQLSSYNYSTDDPPGRLVITLTLQKI